MSDQASLLHITRDHLFEIAISKDPLIPELEIARSRLNEWRTAAQIQFVLEQTHQCMDGSDDIPQTTYTSYRLFRHTGDRANYEAAYFLKRERLAAVALRLFLGQSELKPLVQDYLWSICEESTWVAPAHERLPIDLFSAETAYVLAETLYLLGDILDAEVRHRVRSEVERRVLGPYLSLYQTLDWYKSHHNWNGVCNSALAATFLLLEVEPGRIVEGLEIALDGLQTFIDTAFEEDGSSTEGVLYWHYGLMNFVAFAEMLYARSHGEINILGSERLQRIATYPAQLQLSGSYFANFSDCDEIARFHPGIIQRLFERSHEQSLLNLIARSSQLDSDWRFTMVLRDICWWDGIQPEPAQIDNSYLEDGGVARLVATNSQNVPVVLAIKAGHNAENHNQNDIGSFILHTDGESFLVDPGRGLYTRAYFGAERYENIFANSYGHSVPRIDGYLQSTGRQFFGQFQKPDAVISGQKQVSLELKHAYPCEDLVRATREIALATDGEEAGTVWLHDHFQFSEGVHQIEEAFLTWFDCEVHENRARIHGKQYDLLLTLEDPYQDVHFILDVLENQSKANNKVALLKRLSVVMEQVQEVRVTFKMQLLQVNSGQYVG